MYRKIISFLFCVQILISGYSQNLIPNGDFEGPAPDSLKSDLWYHTPEWSCPHYFPINSSDKAYLEQKRIFGSQKPHKGKAFIGIRFGNFIHADLKKPLDCGKNYCFTMYISMAEKRAAKGQIIVSFRKGIEINVQNENTVNAESKLSFDVMLQAMDSVGWTCVCGTYKAKGGEKYLTIGNYKSITEYKDEKIIYIDDVTLIPQIANSNECCSEELHAESGDTITLKHLLFKTSSAVIETSSFIELDRFADYLKKKQSLKIQIKGHTDNSGISQNNLQLSKDRAKEVYLYFIKKGIKAERMKYEGYGSTLPLFTNDT
jgi:outer membrane protein OmpA-like peptidoglycan-associated protein